jgi:hypothetical protein
MEYHVQLNVRLRPTDLKFRRQLTLGTTLNISVLSVSCFLRLTSYRRPKDTSNILHILANIYGSYGCESDVQFKS